MSKKIIIFSGKQFSGKDTVAKKLLELMPDFKRIGLGDAIKLEYGKQKNLTFDEIEANKSEYRADLIALGNWGRAQDPDYWLKKIIEQEHNVMVPDIRVPHELQIFKSHGAISVRVEASRDQRAKRGSLVNEDDNTETALDNIAYWDFVIENNAGMDELLPKIEQLEKYIKEKLNA